MNVFYEVETNKVHAVTEIVGWENQTVGTIICKHGVGGSSAVIFGRTCGLILTGTSFSLPSGNHKTVPGKHGSFAVDGGDSGATVAYNGKFYGLAVDGDGWYSVGGDIQYDLGIVLCRTSACA